MNLYAELAEVAATLYGLYWLSRLAAWAHRLVTAAREEAPARAEVPRGAGDGVAFSGPEPGRYARIGELK